MFKMYTVHCTEGRRWRDGEMKNVEDGKGKKGEDGEMKNVEDGKEKKGEDGEMKNVEDGKVKKGEDGEMKNVEDGKGKKGEDGEMKNLVKTMDNTAIKIKECLDLMKIIQDFIFIIESRVGLISGLKTIFIPPLSVTP